MLSTEEITKLSQKAIDTHTTPLNKKKNAKDGFRQLHYNTIHEFHNHKDCPLQFTIELVVSYFPLIDHIRFVCQNMSRFASPKPEAMIIKPVFLKTKAHPFS